MATRPQTLFDLMAHPQHQLQPFLVVAEPSGPVAPAAVSPVVSNVVAIDAPKLSKQPVFLGEIDGKEYYLDVNPGTLTRPNPDYNQVTWRVPDIRDSIVAGPGKMIVSCDYSQIEIRIMGFLSQDPWLISAINAVDGNGVHTDMHISMAHSIYGEKLGFTYEEMFEAVADKEHPRNKEFSKLRSRTKRCSFGIPYGISPVGLALLIDDTEEAAAELMALYFGKAKVLAQWLKEQAYGAVHNGYTTTLLGRKRFYEIPHPDDPEAKKLLEQIGRWAGNMPIQGTGADMLKLAMVKLYTELRDGVLTRAAKWGARLLFVVHDEMVTECDEEFVDQMKALVENVMNWAYEQLIGSANVYHSATANAARCWSHD